MIITSPTYIIISFWYKLVELLIEIQTHMRSDIILH